MSINPDQLEPNHWDPLLLNADQSGKRLQLRKDGEVHCGELQFGSLQLGTLEEIERSTGLEETEAIAAFLTPVFQRCLEALQNNSHINI